MVIKKTESMSTEDLTRITSDGVVDSFYTILQTLSLALLKKTPLNQLLKNSEMQIPSSQNNSQLSLNN